MMLFLSFLISPGSAEALVRWGGKIIYFLMVYCLSIIYAKNYLNRFLCVSESWCIFLVHRVEADTATVTFSLTDSDQRWLCVCDVFSCVFVGSELVWQQHRPLSTLLTDSLHLHVTHASQTLVNTNYHHQYSCCCTSLTDYWAWHCHVVSTLPCHLPSVLWHCWLGGRKGIRPVEICGMVGGRHWLVRMEWHPAGWSVCLPLFIFPCTIKSRSSLLASAHPGGPEKGP